MLFNLKLYLNLEARIQSNDRSDAEKEKGERQQQEKLNSQMKSLKSGAILE